MPADISDDLFNALLRVYHGAENATHISGAMLADLTPDLPRLRSAFAAAHTAGVESVPMRYGVLHDGRSLPYTHPGMSRAGVLRLAAADPYNQAVCRRATDWEPLPVEDTNDAR